MTSGEDVCTRRLDLKSVTIAGGFHHLLRLTGFGPLGIAAALWFMAFLTEVGWHVATRAEGPPRIKSACLAGLPAVVIIVYLAGTHATATTTLAITFNAQLMSCLVGVCSADDRVHRFFRF